MIPTNAVITEVFHKIKLPYTRRNMHFHALQSYDAVIAIVDNNVMLGDLK